MLSWGLFLRARWHMVWRPNTTGDYQSMAGGDPRSGALLSERHSGCWAWNPVEALRTLEQHTEGDYELIGKRHTVETQCGVSICSSVLSFIYSLVPFLLHWFHLSYIALSVLSVITGREHVQSWASDRYTSNHPPFLSLVTASILIM